MSFRKIAFMNIEPELPYFPLPLEHQRPTRRWGAYRADALANVGGIEWGFRNFGNYIFFTALPFVAEINEIFAAHRWAASTLENFVEILEQIKDSPDTLSATDIEMYRVINQYWNGEVIFALGCDGKGRIMCAGNGVFKEEQEINFVFNHNIALDALFKMSNEHIEDAVSNCVDFIDLTWQSSRWYVGDAERPTIAGEANPESVGNECYGNPSKAQCLADNGHISSHPRKMGEYPFDTLIACALKIEDAVWRIEKRIVGKVATDSQFEPACCKFFGIAVNDEDEEEELSEHELTISNRMSIIIDIALDEFNLNGARFYKGLQESFAAMPFGSIEFCVADTTEPTQNEKVEAAIVLRRWLSSVDISEEDIEQLITDKLSKDWLSQQDKIKW